MCPTWVPTTRRFSSGPVEWLWDNSLTTGSPAGSETFKPLDNVTRGEYATFNFRYDTNVVQPALTTINGRLDTAEADIDTAESDIDDLETNVATVASDVNNMTRVHFARVAADGTVEKTGNDAITVVKNGSSGSYTATLPEDAQNCTIQTSLYGSVDGAANELVQNLEYALEAWVWAIHNNEDGQPDEQVDIFTYYRDDPDDSNLGVAADMPFSITAFCSDPTFFFNPGIIIPPIITLTE